MRINYYRPAKMLREPSSEGRCSPGCRLSGKDGENLVPSSAGQALGIFGDAPQRDGAEAMPGPGVGSHFPAAAFARLRGCLGLGSAGSRCCWRAANPQNGRKPPNRSQTPDGCKALGWLRTPQKVANPPNGCKAPCMVANYPGGCNSLPASQNVANPPKGCKPPPDG